MEFKATARAFPMNPVAKLSSFASLPERLESRIAPAVLLNPHKVIYTDADGDRIAVQTTKGDLTGRLTFDTPFGSTGAQQLQIINLADAQFSKASLEVKVTKHSPGNGFANVGMIDATGVDLRAVKVSGDLGQIIAGDVQTENGSLKKIRLGSLGTLGVTTGASSLLSTLTGSVGALTIAGDLEEARFLINGDDFGNLKALVIKGSLLGGSTNHAGAINVTGQILSAQVGGDMTGSGTNSAQITANKAIGTVKIGGDLKGGLGDSSGIIRSSGSLDKVKIGGMIKGGDGGDSGSVVASGSIHRGVRVHGSILGGDGENSGAIISGDSMGPIKVMGDLSGSDGPSSGEIKCKFGVLRSVFIGGSLRGGTGADSGEIATFGTKMGPVVIMHDIVSDLRMTTNGVFDTAEIEAVGVSASRLTKVTVHGSLLGGNIIANGNIGKVKVLGSVVGGMADRSGFIGAEPDGSNHLATTIGTVKVGHDVVGGAGSESGSIAAINIRKVTIGDTLKSGVGNQAGSIRAQGQLTTVKIKGGVVGNSDHAVVISGGGHLLTGGSKDVAIETLKIGKDVSFLDVLAGYDLTGAPINGHAQIVSVKAGGDWTGSNIVAGATAGDGGFFGSATDAAIPSTSSIISKIAKVTIAGSVNPTAGADDSFGLVAQNVAEVRIGGLEVATNPGAHNDVLLPVGGLSDLFVNEVADA